MTCTEAFDRYFRNYVADKQYRNACRSVIIIILDSIFMRFSFFSYFRTYLILQFRTIKSATSAHNLTPVKHDDW